MPTTPDTTYVVEPTPDITNLDTVEPLPFDIRTEWFERADGELTPAGAEAILTEVWRLTRNPRLLEMEQETRGQLAPDLSLTTLAHDHVQFVSENGTLDPTAVARTFIDYARDYPEQVADGPDPLTAHLGSPTALNNTSPTDSPTVTE